MNRRDFLASMIATAVLDPERFLWVPGRRTIFIPPAPFIELGVHWLIGCNWSAYKTIEAGWVGLGYSSLKEAIAAEPQWLKSQVERYGFDTKRRILYQNRQLRQLRVL